jgi:hypothetical protein
MSAAERGFPNVPSNDVTGGRGGDRLEQGSRELPLDELVSRGYPSVRAGPS